MEEVVKIFIISNFKKIEYYYYLYIIISYNPLYNYFEPTNNELNKSK